MCVHRYDEEFEAYYAPFVEATWTLLTQTGEEPKYDTLVAIAMKYLSHVAQKPSHADTFAAAETLQAICQQVSISSFLSLEWTRHSYRKPPLILRCCSIRATLNY